MCLNALKCIYSIIEEYIAARENNKVLYAVGNEKKGSRKNHKPRCLVHLRSFLLCASKGSANCNPRAAGNEKGHHDPDAIEEDEVEPEVKWVIHTDLDTCQKHGQKIHNVSIQLRS